MTPHEFAQWRALDRIEPFGGRRSDIQTALVVRSLSAAFGAPGTRTPDLEDFIVQWWRDKGGSDGG